MKFESRKLEDGALQVTVTLPKESQEMLGNSATNGFFDKTDYCVTCHGGKKYTIEAYGDIAANIEAAATCLKQVGDPSYGLSKGRCS